MAIKKKKVPLPEDKPKKKKKKVTDADKPKKKKQPEAETPERVAPALPAKKKKKKKKPKPEPEEVIPEAPKETEAERYQRELREEEEKKSREDRAFRQLQHMKHRDLQKACILRGISGPELVSKSTPQLAGWFTDHLDDGQDILRLDEHDRWRDEELRKRGVLDGDALMHPALKFGDAGKSTDWGPGVLKNSTQPLRDVKAPKEEKPKKEKSAPREKDESKGGIFKGTKKHYTYELTQKKAKKGKLSDEALKWVIDEVIKVFPEANDKSIKIWAKRALKEIKK